MKLKTLRISNSNLEMQQHYNVKHRTQLPYICANNQALHLQFHIDIIFIRKIALAR